APRHPYPPPFPTRRSSDLELPSGLKDSSAIQVAVLAQRPSSQIVGFRVYSSVDNASYDLVAPENNFAAYGKVVDAAYPSSTADRSEEHTSELQSPDHLVCR